MDINKPRYQHFLKALDDEVRRDIVSILLKEEVNVSRIADRVYLDASTISYHLTILTKAGLIKKAGRQGKEMYYTATSTMLSQEIAAFLAGISSKYEIDFERKTVKVSETAESYALGNVEIQNNTKVSKDKEKSSNPELEAIDEQHKNLLWNVDLLEKYVKEEYPLADIYEVFKSLELSFEAHCRLEQLHMKQNIYDKLDNHTKIHQQLQKKLNELTGLISTDSPIRLDCQEIDEHIRKPLQKHFDGPDKLYGLFLSEQN